MGEIKNFRLTNDQAKTFEHLKNTLNLKTDASLFRFLLECGYERVFGNDEEREKILKELSKIKNESSESNKESLKYLKAIADSLSIMNQRNNESFEIIEKADNKNYQAILETLRQAIKSNTSFRQDPDKIFQEIRSKIDNS